MLGSLKANPIKAPILFFGQHNPRSLDPPSVGCHYRVFDQSLGRRTARLSRPLQLCCVGAQRSGPPCPMSFGPRFWPWNNLGPGGLAASLEDIQTDMRDIVVSHTPVFLSSLAESLDEHRVVCEGDSVGTIKDVGQMTIRRVEMFVVSVLTCAPAHYAM